MGSANFSNSTFLSQCQNDGVCSPDSSTTARIDCEEQPCALPGPPGCITFLDVTLFTLLGTCAPVPVGLQPITYSW